MPLYIAKDFSIDMLTLKSASILYEEIDVSEARRILKVNRMIKIKKDVVSAVDDEAIAKALSLLVGVKIPVGNAEVRLGPEDVLLVVKAKELPKELSKESVEEYVKTGKIRLYLMSVLW